MAGSLLRERWRALAAAGWAYPSDWHVESVDAVCEALADRRDPWDAAERLGRDRATAAVGLPETLADIDALTAIVAAPLAEQLRRAVSLGWSAVATAPPVTIVDPMTGLASAGYLQVRLGELYRAAAASEVPASQSHALVMIRVVTGVQGLGRRLPMVIVADALRAVFDGGETLAVLSDSMITVLTERTPRLARRVALARQTAQRLLHSDEQAAPARVRAWIESLPPTAATAVDLLGDLGR